MFSFLALSWKEEERTACDFALSVCRQLGLRGNDSRAYTSPGFALFDLASASPQPSMFPIEIKRRQAWGAIYGTLFRNNSDALNAPVRRLTHDECLAISTSNGRSIIGDFWGSYVAFLKTEDGFSVIADPTSAIPCYFTRHNGVSLVFSHLEKCPFATQLNLRFNLRFIAAVVAYDKIQNGETGFLEICEVMGGNRLTVSKAGVVTETLWDPRTFARAREEPGQSEAELLIRNTVKLAVSNWAGKFERITVNLSGGLDSSIVLSCLTNDRPSESIQAVHYSFESGDPSEVRYAREAAAFCNCTLHELYFSPTDTLPSAHSHPLTARPYRQFVNPPLTELIGPQRRVFGDAVFTGEGGDHLFRALRTPLGFTDYLHNRSRLKNIFQELMNSAKLSRQSIWDVIHQAALGLSRPHESAMIAAIRHNQTLVSKLVHDDFDSSYAVPDWVSNADGIPPGKFDQVSTLIHMFLMRDVLDQPITRTFVHPLVSQPLIELTLKLPIYLLCANGTSRGLVRNAFRGLIPENIRTRIGKGESTRFAVDRVMCNREQIVEALRAGQLVSHGIVASDDLVAFASSKAVQTASYGQKLLIYYSIESWMRSWSMHLSQRSPIT